MPNKLEQLKINRADLVDSPSNPLAHVVLFKRDVAKNLYGPKTVDGILAREEFWMNYYKYLNSFTSSVDSILYDHEIEDAKRVSMLKTSVKEVSKLLNTLFDSYPVEKADNPENEEIYTKMEKTVDVLTELDTLLSSGEISVEEIHDILEGLDMPVDKKTEANEIETLKSDLTKKSAELENANTELAKLKTDVADLQKQLTEKIEKKDEVEDIWKGVNPAVKAQFEELKKQADENAKIAKAAEENAAVIKLTKRVNDELAGIVGTTDEKVSILRSIEKMSTQEQFEKLYTILKTASEAIKKSELLVEKGRSGNDGSTGNTAFEKIRVKAQELVQKGQAKTEAEAIALTARQNPELYKEYIEEGKN